MKRYIELGPEGSREQELLFLWNWGAPPSCHPDELTNPEGLCLLVNVLFAESNCYSGIWKLIKLSFIKSSF